MQERLAGMGETVAQANLEKSSTAEELGNCRTELGNSTRESRSQPAGGVEGTRWLAAGAAGRRALPAGVWYAGQWSVGPCSGGVPSSRMQRVPLPVLPLTTTRPTLLSFCRRHPC